jgi:uncharacterized protein YidB (DUF937 family)
MLGHVADRPDARETRTMGDIGKLLGGLGGGSSAGGGGAGGDIVGAIGGLVGGEGGLSGLIDTLGKGGLADIAKSWVDTGANRQVDPAKLGEVLGDEKVNELAGKAGLPVAALLPLLASALPAVIDALTPDGKVPEGDAAKGFDIGGLLQGLADAANAGPDSPLAGLGKLLGGS